MVDTTKMECTHFGTHVYTRSENFLEEELKYIAEDNKEKTRADDVVLDSDEEKKPFKGGFQWLTTWHQNITTNSLIIQHMVGDIIFKRSTISTMEPIMIWLMSLYPVHSFNSGGWKYLDAS